MLTRTLYEVALAAITALARPAPADVPRLERLAGDVVLAVELGADPFEDSTANALALVAIAWHESGFRPEVADCRVAGDSGRSVTAWQLMGPWAWGGASRADVCNHPALAAYLALGVLERHAERCPRAPWRAVFGGYASGSCGRPSAAASRQCAIWARLARAEGLVASCDDRRAIGRAE